MISSQKIKQFTQFILKFNEFDVSNPIQHIFTNNSEIQEEKVKLILHWLDYLELFDQLLILN